jgi:ketosteroid isomerase-like protein
MISTPQLVLASFLDALSRLDPHAIRDHFTPAATAFFPGEYRHTRLDGADAIGSAFAAVAARLRATGATSLPLDAQDVLVQEWGDTAIVTFHLRDERLCRRTLVLCRHAAVWQIVHMHASNVALDG